MATKIDIAPNHDRELVLARIDGRARPSSSIASGPIPSAFRSGSAPKPWRAEVHEDGAEAGRRGRDHHVRPRTARCSRTCGVYLEVVPNKKIVFTDAFTEGWVPAARAAA